MNGEVVGATALDYAHGKFIVVKAKSVILATGGGGKIWRHHTESKEQVGDGLAMAYRVGAELLDLELVTWHPAEVAWPLTYGELNMYLHGVGDVCQAKLGVKMRERR